MIGIAKIGQPNINHSKSLPGKYQIPNLIENESNNIAITAVESVSIRTSFLEFFDKLVNLLVIKIIGKKLF